MASEGVRLQAARTSHRRERSALGKGRERWASPKTLGKATAFVYVFVDDVENLYARAKGAGATIVMEMETSYGQKRFRCLDLEGHEWCFSQEVEA